MVFEKNDTVRWHDTDANRVMRPSQFLVCMQETANLQLKENGVSLDLLRDRDGLAFLLTRLSIRFYEPVRSYEELRVQTWVCDGKGANFDRCFRILREEKTVAEAYSCWALADLRNRTFLRNGQFSYPFTSEQPIAPPLPLRFRVPPADQMEEVGTRRIVYSDIDYNGHMNNTRYPDMLCDFIPDVLDCEIRGMSLSYLREAAYGHSLRVLRSEGEKTADGYTTYLFRTVNENRETCLEAMVWAEKKPS